MMTMILLQPERLPFEPEPKPPRRLPRPPKPPLPEELLPDEVEPPLKLEPLLLEPDDGVIPILLLLDEVGRDGVC